MQTLIRHPISLKAPPPSLESLQNGLKTVAALIEKHPDDLSYWLRVQKILHEQIAKLYPEPSCTA